MFSIARIFEVMIATAFYSGLVYMFYDGTGPFLPCPPSRCPQHSLQFR